MCFQFAADFAEKTLFRTLMVRLLKSALQEDDEKGGEENVSNILTEEMLSVDKQLLQVERATGEISGESSTNFHPN